MILTNRIFSKYAHRENYINEAKNETTSETAQPVIHETELLEAFVRKPRREK